MKNGKGEERIKKDGQLDGFFFLVNDFIGEAITNAQMIILANLYIDPIEELHQFVTIRNIKESRTNSFTLSKINYA